MNSLLVKICGMTDSDNLNEILRAAEEVKRVPSMFGFILAKESKRCLTFQKALALAKSLPGSIKRVLVTVNPNFAEIVECFREDGFTHVQFHGEEDASFLSKFRQQAPKIKIIKAVSVDETFDIGKLKEFEGSVDFFLFDSKGIRRGGNGVKFSWELLSSYNLDVPFFLSGGIKLEDATSIKKLSQSYPNLIGVDINSGFEISAGVKDPKLVAEFLRELNLE